MLHRVQYVMCLILVNFKLWLLKKKTKQNETKRNEGRTIGNYWWTVKWNSLSMTRFLFSLEKVCTLYLSAPFHYQYSCDNWHICDSFTSLLYFVCKFGSSTVQAGWNNHLHVIFRININDHVLIACGLLTCQHHWSKLPLTWKVLYNL